MPLSPKQGAGRQRSGPLLVSWGARPRPEETQRENDPHEFPRRARALGREVDPLDDDARLPLDPIERRELVRPAREVQRDGAHDDPLRSDVQAALLRPLPAGTELPLQFREARRVPDRSGGGSGFLPQGSAGRVRVGREPVAFRQERGDARLRESRRGTKPGHQPRRRAQQGTARQQGQPRGRNCAMPRHGLSVPRNRKGAVPPAGTSALRRIPALSSASLFSQRSSGLPAACGATNPRASNASGVA